MNYPSNGNRIYHLVSRLWHQKGIQKLVPSKLYIRLQFHNFMGKSLNLKNPVTYNEKLQWLKLYDRRPEYTKLVDKYEVRSYIAEQIGEQYLIPLLGVYDSFDEIDFDALPSEFVLKPTHTSGDFYLCKNKSEFKPFELKKEVSAWLKRNYYLEHREWPYKNVKPRIICEKYMVDESGVELKDYKFFCFHGEPKFLYVISSRRNDKRMDFFDLSFDQLPIRLDPFKNSAKTIKRPVGFEEMVRLSKILSKDLRHVRVDFYNINGTIYFGELTFYPSSGLKRFEPEEFDKIVGNYIKLEA